MKKIIIIVLALAVVLGFVFWKFGPSLFSGTKKVAGPVKLTYWGLWEDENLIKGVIAEYQKVHPDVQITYSKQSSVNYRTRLQTQINEGGGPDIYRIHNSWLPELTGYLNPAPIKIFSVSDYESMFYPVAKESFVSGQYVFAAPMEIDGLAMYYNEDILSAAGVTVPTNWQEFINSAFKMTVVDPQTKIIQTAGAAMGTSTNVDHFSDILGLLLLQQGIDLTNPDPAAMSEVVKFYTGFVTDEKRKTWDPSLPSSTQAFAEGRVAFYLAPSWRASELRVANPQLKFKIAPVPQLPGRQVAWASFWGEAVSSKSKNPTAAWEFVKYLTSKESQKAMYTQASQIRLFGEPYSQIDLAPEVANDPLVGAFVTQGPYYKGWYLSSNTMDGGINDEMIKYFEDGITSVIKGGTPENAVATMQKGMTQVLDKYFKPAATPKK